MFDINYIWLEITVIPFLAVMSVFLAGRMATSSEINKRFLSLVISTLAAASLEAAIDISPLIHSVPIYTKIFYALSNINSYCLMTYVAAYTGSNSKRLIGSNFFLLSSGLIVLFSVKDIAGIHMMFAPAFTILFMLEAFVLQLIFQQYYGNGQFIVMNILFILLIDAFLMQYLFRQNIPLVYTVATIMLVFTFFYLEAPTYRQLLIAHKEIDAARKQAEASIMRANIANKAKSNFLASTSHEIRTPMNAILGINDMILAENPETECRNAALAVKSAGEYLLTLVNNILDISKIEAGKMELYETDYHLWEILKECENIMTERLMGNYNIRFSIITDDNTPEHLHGDALRLKQALVNLLTNSAKYTQKGNITLSVAAEKISAHQAVLLFSVNDTGIGIHQNELDKIFEPFERANVVETRHILGAGLGLTLVKSIAGIMNGHISVKSSYGKGSAFSLKIPQNIVPDTMTIGDYENFISKQITVNDNSHNNNISAWPEASILVVDDTPVNLVVAEGMLKSSEAHIDTAENGEDALALMKNNHYDIVFLDHKMPGMDGVETLNRAKKISPASAFIALTANSGGNARNQYIAMGFDDFLPKPFKKNDMFNILRTFLH